MTDDKRLITPEDLGQLRQFSDLVISPDNRWAAFVRQDVDLTANAYTRNLWLADLQTGALYQLTRSGKDSQPAWSPDSRSLAFTSARAGKPQIYLISIVAPGGEPRQLTNQPNGANSPAFSPDGATVAYLAASSAAERRKADDPDADIMIPDDDARFDPRVITSVPYRVGTSYLSDRTQQIMVQAVAEDSDQPARRLTDFDADHQYPRWSADGRSLTFSRVEALGVDEPFRRTRIYRLEIESGTITQLTDNTHAAVMPTPSPDGRWLAFLRFPNEQMSLKYNRLAVLDLESGAVRDVSVAVDASPVAFAWGGGDLYFSAPVRGRSVIYRVDPASGDAVAVVDGDFRVDVFAAGEDGTLIYAAATSQALVEVVQRAPDGTTRQLTHVHRAFLESVTTSAFEELIYPVADGSTVQGWFLLPPGYTPGRRYPLIVNIHGGPHLMWSANDENMWHEFQTMAAQGYVVFFCNPRGSMGYGEAFQVAIQGQWGELAMADIMAGVDALIAKGLVDESQMYITGGSYGGYMTTWIVGHTDRFRAAVTQRGVYNLLSFFGTTDIPSFVDNEFGYTPLTNAQALWEKSPLAHVQNIRTPLMVIHSENDFRVAISEGEQLFGYLRYQGVPTEFIRYPREGHELSRSGEPKHRIDRLQRIMGWFERYRG